MISSLLFFAFGIPLFAHQITIETPLGGLIRSAQVVVEGVVLTDTQSVTRLDGRESYVLTRIAVSDVFKGELDKLEISVLGFDDHSATYRQGERIILCLQAIGKTLSVPKEILALSDFSTQQGKLEKIILNNATAPHFRQFIVRYHETITKYNDDAERDALKDLLIQTLDSPVPDLIWDAFLDLTRFKSLDTLLTPDDISKLLNIIEHEEVNPIIRIALISLCAQHLSFETHCRLFKQVKTETVQLAVKEAMETLYGQRLCRVDRIEAGKVQ